MGSQGLFLVEEGIEIWKDDDLIKSYFLLVAPSVPFKLWPIFCITINQQGLILLFWKASYIFQY